MYPETVQDAPRERQGSAPAGMDASPLTEECATTGKVFRDELDGGQGGTLRLERQVMRQGLASRMIIELPNAPGNGNKRKEVMPMKNT